MSNNKQTKGEKLQKSAKCKNKQSSPISKTAWIDLNSKWDILNLHDLCGKDVCKYPKTICYTPKQFEMEGAGFKKKRKRYSKVVRKLGTLFLNQLQPH